MLNQRKVRARSACRFTRNTYQEKLLKNLKQRKEEKDNSLNIIPAYDGKSKEITISINSPINTTTKNIAEQKTFEVFNSQEFGKISEKEGKGLGTANVMLAKRP